MDFGALLSNGPIPSASASTNWRLSLPSHVRVPSPVSQSIPINCPSAEKAVGGGLKGRVAATVQARPLEDD